MLKNISVICLVFVISIILIGTASCAKKKPEKFEEKLSQMIDRISDSLDLTESQKLATDLIKDEILKKNEEIKNFIAKDGMGVEEAFTKQIKSEKFDVAELNKMLDIQNIKREEMRRFMIGELAKFHAILTPAQRIKLSEILKNLGPGRRPPGPGRDGPRFGEMPEFQR